MLAWRHTWPTINDCCLLRATNCSFPVASALRLIYNSNQHHLYIFLGFFAGNDLTICYIALANITSHRVILSPCKCFRHENLFQLKSTMGSFSTVSVDCNGKHCEKKMLSSRIWKLVFFYHIEYMNEIKRCDSCSFFYARKYSQ